MIGNIVLGLLVAGDYGESVDEYGDFKYGEDTLQAYVAPEQVENHGDREYYGPFYLMAASVSSDIFARLRPGWLTSEGRHFSNFLAFEMGVFFFYVLATRFADRWTALAASALFGFQPLLFGHSFINQKDIPFMAFFTASIALGLISADAVSASELRSAASKETQAASLDELRGSAARDWSHATFRIKAGLIISLALPGLLAIDLAGARVILPWLQELVRGAYQGTAWGPIVSLFHAAATDAYKTPVAQYLDKLDRAYFWLRWPVVVLAFLPSVFVARSVFDMTVRQLGSGWFRTRGLVILAGVILGLCTSIRVAGPLAGALISLAFVARLGRRSLVPLIGYWLAACLTAYATWPFLWRNPLAGLWQSIRLMGNFPVHTVLYDGRLIASSLLPWHFLPRLLAIELTEPAVVLTVLGAAVSVPMLLRNQGRRVDLAIVGLWFGLPAGAAVLLGTPLYGNLRQVFFILPALFLSCAIAVSWIFGLVKNRGLQVTFLALILLPGFVAIARLHPYEYIYYNSFIGGVDGAVGRYEIDPWCISYREATDYVNRVAPQNATIAIAGTETGGVATFARADLTIESSIAGSRPADFAIACKRTIGAQSFYPEMVTVYQVRRGQAILAEVKQAR
jgi:hypothetical protein